jgi:quercetin dioxygenase-like cupin family protein
MIHSQPDKSRITVEIIEYIPNALMHRTVVRKHSGTVNTSSMDASIFGEKKSAHDSFLQVVEGMARVRVDDTDQNLSVGETMHISPDQAYSIHSAERFKMILSIVKPDQYYNHKISNINQH